MSRLLGLTVLSFFLAPGSGFNNALTRPLSKKFLSRRDARHPSPCLLNTQGLKRTSVLVSNISFTRLKAGLSRETSRVEQSATNTRKENAAKDAHEILDEKDSYSAIKDLQKLNIEASIASKLSPFLVEKLIHHEIHGLLPIQTGSFDRIFDGHDAILQSPTGSGKTIAFVLPIVARKWKGGKRVPNQAAPSVLVLAPSRELARQVGREFSKFSKGSSFCATVFGGVPIERHISILKNKPQILVGTPGRLRELAREGFLDYSQVKSIILDEADTLLDKADSPDVRSILSDIKRAVGERDPDAEYQLILVSATINDNVLQFTQKMGIPAKAQISVQGDYSKTIVDARSTESLSQSKMASASSEIQQQVRTPKSQSVRHWHTSCKSSVRISVARDFVSILSPNLTIIFVPTKAESESVASELATTFGNGVVRALHGDMAQSFRSRTMAIIRESALKGDPQILVATDVAARGIDLSVDLVIQFGVPRLSGKEGTFSSELYTHRTGRTGRVRSAVTRDGVKPSNAIMLYDPSSGEGKLVPQLAREIQDMLELDIVQRPLPATADVIKSGFARAKRLVDFPGPVHGEENELVAYFQSMLEREEGIDTSNPKELLKYLSRSMVALSDLDASLSPHKQHSSLLTGSASDRTLRLYQTNEEPVTRSEVTKICKEMGSGKLGRVQIHADGSATFDLPTKRVTKLMESFNERDGDFHLEMPLSLPSM